MAENDPFRLRILQALTNVLRGVTPANGYQHDLSQAVFRGRTQFGTDDPSPLVSILEAPVSAESMPTPQASELAGGDWPLIVQIFVRDDPQNPTDPAHRLMADVRRAVAIERARRDPDDFPFYLGFGGDGRSNNAITEIQIGQPVVRPADNEISDTAFGLLPVTLRLVEDATRPFTSA